MTIIVLLRHGENDWVKKHRLAGWIPDVHLNKKGRKQAKDAAKRLGPLKIDALYSSPVTRCLETAEFVAKEKGLDIVLLDDMGEVRYGDWEGKKIAKLAKKPEWGTVQFFPSRMRFPEGEALREVQFRAVQALERISIEQEDKTVVVVSHADVIKLTLAHFLGVHIDLFQRISVSPASVSVLLLTKEGMVRVLRLNDDGPLQSFSSPGSKNKKNK